MKVRDRRRSTSITLTDEVTDIEGAAHLCFSENGDWFQGHLVSAEQSTYSISGNRIHPRNSAIQETFPDEWYVNNSLNSDESSLLDKENHNGLIHDTDDVYEVVVVDHEQGTRYTFEAVPRKTGHKCLLKSKKFIFESETFYKGQRADMVIQNFLPRLVGQNLNVHAGRMTITVHKRPEPLIKWTM